MENNPIEQFLRPLIAAIVLKDTIQIDVRRGVKGILASVVVDRDDQPMIIGQAGQNVIALGTIFNEWCLRTFQLNGRLAVMEPVDSSGKSQKKTRQSPHNFLNVHADWLIGELYVDSPFEVTLEKTTDTEANLHISLDEEVEAELLAGLTRYFRTVGKNHGLTTQVYVRRHTGSRAHSK